MKEKVMNVIRYCIAVIVVAVPMGLGTFCFFCFGYIKKNPNLATTGIIIFFYTYETYKLRKISEQGAIAERRPVLLIDSFMSDGTLSGEVGVLRIKNSGKGTALDIGVTISGVNLMSEYNPGDIPEKEDKTVVIMKDVFNIAVADKESATLTLSYADLSGITYKTDITIATDFDVLPSQRDIKDVRIYET